MMHAMHSNIESPDRGFAVDTTFVLFFLALDLGLSFGSFGFDDVLSILTLAAFVTVPYLLPSNGEKPDFESWAFGRTLIALFGLALGVAFKQSLGTVLPIGFGYLPMTLLIVSATASCYLQLFSIMRFRLVK
jgi:hypothetical protein